MRTKAIILSAAVLAAGVASSMAQSNVYSLNVVGYVNTTVKPGFNMIANPLDDGAGDYLTNVLGGNSGTLFPVNGANVYPWFHGTYGDTIAYFPGYGWFDGNTSDGSVTNQIPPGSGFWVQNLETTNVSITFVGTVLQGSTTNSIGGAFTLAGSTVPVSLPIGYNTDGVGNTNSLQFPAADGDNLFLYNNPGGYYPTIQFFAGYGWFDSTSVYGVEGPAINVGQGFFIQKSGVATNWIQNFIVH